MHVDEYWTQFSPKVPLPLLYVKSLIWFNILVKKTPEHKLTINDVKKGEHSLKLIYLSQCILFAYLFLFLLTLAQS